MDAFEVIAWTFTALGLGLVGLAIFFAQKRRRQQETAVAERKLSESPGGSRVDLNPKPTPEPSPEPEPEPIPESFAPPEPTPELDPMPAPESTPMLERDPEPFTRTEPEIDPAFEVPRSEPTPNPPVDPISEGPFLTPPEPKDAAALYAGWDTRTQTRFASLAIMSADFDLPAMAAIWNTDEVNASRFLEDRVEEGLLESPMPDRYQLTEAVHTFATEQFQRLPEDAQPNATTLAWRYVKYYRDLLAKAHAQRDGTAEDLLASKGQAAREWPHLEAAQAWTVAALESSQDPKVAQLASDFAFFAEAISSQQLPDEARLEWLETGLQAARQLEDQTREGNHLSKLGTTCLEMGDEARANDYFDQAYQVLEKLSDANSRS